MAGKDTESGFLSRWSRRKLEGEDARQPDAGKSAAKGATGEEAAAPPAGASEAGRGGVVPRDAAPEETDGRELTEEDVDKLGPGADYTVFMKKGVAPHVQRLALRKLWRSDPVFANLDGLVEYGDDFRAEAAASLGKVASLWQPGRGLLKGEEAAAEDDAPAEAPEEVAEATPAGEAEEGEQAASEPAPDDGDDAEKA